MHGILDYRVKNTAKNRKLELEGIFKKRNFRVAVISAKKHKRHRRKHQFVTAKREKSQTPNVLTAILTLPNLT